MNIDQIVFRMKERPYLLEMGCGKLSRMFKCSEQDIRDSRNIVKLFTVKKPRFDGNRLTGKNILIIGDTHLPYELDGYLEFCKEQYDLYDCDTVIHVGDLIDSHATSRHPCIPDAYSPGDELSYSIKKLKKWYSAFPEMNVCIGNHDQRINKIASDSHISSKWLRDYNEVLKVPNWNFKEYFEIDDTLFTHGTGTSGICAAYNRSLNIGKNVVIGHLHSEANILYHKLSDKTVFGMIVGCGVDEESYGMNYAKNFIKKSIISCGLIIDGQPMIRIMK